MSTLNIAGNTAAEVVFASAGADTAPILGTLQTITTDMVILPISGGQWATAKFSVGTGGTATATAQVSIDGGKNYNPSAYAKRTSAVSANPTTQAISATALVTGDVWEVPLPGNCTHFQLLCGGTGTATTVTLSGGALYVPGVPVVATLYDVTVAFTVAAASPTLDLTGWSVVTLDATNNDTGGVNRALYLAPIFNDGAGNASVPAQVTIATGVAGYQTFGGGIVTGGYGMAPPRGVANLTAGTGAGGSSRIAVVVRR